MIVIWRQRIGSGCFRKSRCDGKNRCVCGVDFRAYQREPGVSCMLTRTHIWSTPGLPSARSQC
eukprot:200676-Chlamydomonas_euryale.AAC.11